MHPHQAWVDSVAVQVKNFRPIRNLRAAAWADGSNLPMVENDV